MYICIYVYMCIYIYIYIYVCGSYYKGSLSAEGAPLWHRCSPPTGFHTRHIIPPSEIDLGLSLG